MFQTYLKLAFRNIIKSKAVNGINIVGLSVGVAVAMLIILFVQTELSMDSNQLNKDNIYRLENGEWGVMPTAAAVTMAEQFPEIESYVRIEQSSPVITKKSVHYAVEKAMWVDSTFLDIFSFDILTGNKPDLLSKPFSIVLTRSLATKIFGNNNPVGETVKFYNTTEYTITGVLDDPVKFQLPFEMLISLETQIYINKEIENYLNRWNRWNYITYFLLSPDADYKALQDKINTYCLERMEWEEQDASFVLRPMSDVYFNGDLLYEAWTLHGNMNNIYILIAIAAFLVVIASINFINLTTARASLRAKEIGIRKVSGANKKQLIFQIFIESFLLVTIAFFLALAIINAALPEFNYLIGKNISIENFDILRIILYFVIGISFVGLLSGIYPAFYLAAMQPVSILRGEATKGKNASLFRKGLILFQFVLSNILIIGTIIIFTQTMYMKNTDVGYQKDQVVSVQLYGPVYNKTEAFKEDLLQNSEIETVSMSNRIPGQITWQSTFYLDGKEQQFTCLWVDENYVELFGLEILEGRNFSEEIPTDLDHACLLNEAAVAILGLENPLGKELSSYHDSNDKLAIIGVVKDYHYNSLHERIAPLLIIRNDRYAHMAHIKLAANSIPEGIEHIRSTWKSMAEGMPLEYSFIDKVFDDLYKSEEQFGKIFTYFALLAIIIASLGLFSLASYTTLQRTKEFGIRKAIGASVNSLVALITKEFIYLVLIACLFSFPIAYYIMDIWLHEFAYRIDIGYSSFAISACISVIIAMITVSYRALKVAMMNPVDSLRDD